MKHKKIIIAGGSGFIGRSLAKRWANDNQIIILGRQAPGNNHWDGEHVEPHWAKELEGCDLITNLAGRSVNCRYTRRNRKEILDSRVNATKAIGQAIRESTIPAKLWINMASATIYRHAEDRPQDEYNGEMEDDFSVQVCKCWEKTFFGQRTPFTRKIALRTAITLGEGGAMMPYQRLVKWGLGGRQGSGKQMCSWVHIDDIGRAIEWFLDHPDLEGAYNISAPDPVTNARFMATLRREMNHPFGLPAPTWLLKLGAPLVGTETELILKSRWVLPAKLERTGFAFSHPRLKEALASLINRN